MKRAVKRFTKFLKENKKTALVLFYVAIAIDLLFINKSYDLLIFGLLFIYVFFIKIYKIKSRWTFLLSLVLLFFMFVSYLFFAASTITEKSAVWLILFMFVGVIQQWRELSRKKQAN